MPGSLRERGPKVYELRASLGKGPDGRYRQVSRTFHGTQKEAEKALRKLVVEAEAGKLGHLHEKTTTGDVLERWFALRKLDLSPTTVRTYRGYLDRHIIPAVGKVPLDKLTTDRLEEFYGSLRASGRSVSTVRQVHAIVHKGLQQAKRWKLVPFNVASDVELPTKRKTEFDLPTQEEALSMVRAIEAEDPEYATWLICLTALGRRRGELCGLRWTRVDLEEGVAVISRAVIDGVPGGWMEKDTKAHTSNPMILDPVSLAALRHHRRYCEDRAARAGVTLKPDAFVFSRRLDGAEPWRPEYTTRRFRELREKLGLRYFRQHDLRHMVATILLPEVNAVDLAARLGWSDPAMLFRVYGHASAKEDLKAARVIGKTLDDAQKPRPLPPAEGTEGAAIGGNG